MDGLTIGKTYSFFMDLEAGPMTVDLQGPNTQISRTHNLIGYTLPLGKRWTVAAALEAPHTIGESYQKYNVSSDYNQFPDFAAHLKYRGDKGQYSGAEGVTQDSSVLNIQNYSSCDFAVEEGLKCRERLQFVVNSHSI